MLQVDGTAYPHWRGTATPNTGAQLMIWWGPIPPTTGRTYHLPRDKDIYGLPNVQFSIPGMSIYEAINPPSNLVLKVLSVDARSGGSFDIEVQAGSIIADANGATAKVAGEIRGVFP